MAAIRNGQLQDVEQIIEISREYISRESRHESGSFLIRELDSKDVSEHIHEFYVALEKDEVAGYVWIKDSYPKLREEHTEFSEKVDLNHLVYIKQVAVRPKFSRKGIASFLYQYIRESNPEKRLAACVAVEPMRNEPSILFHQKTGFRQVGILSLHDYLGFDLYKAIVFLLD